MWRPTQHGDNAKTAALGSPPNPWRVGIGEKPRAVREPGANSPVDPTALELIRLWDGLCLAPFDEFDVEPHPVGVRQVSSIRRNCTPRHDVLARVSCELPPLHFRRRIIGTRLTSSEPQSRTGNDCDRDNARGYSLPTGARFGLHRLLKEIEVRVHF